MSGAGNDFVVLDGRGIDVSEFQQPKHIAELCREYRTDGLMILDDGDADFRMEFFNPDGSGGMMCGNGGRCIVAFADWLGIAPSAPDRYTFLAPDGLHTAEILSRPGGGCGTTSGGTSFASSTPQIPALRGPRNSLTTAPPSGAGPHPLPVSGGGHARQGLSTTATTEQWTVRLKMIDVEGISELLGGYFLNTGTRHFVKFVDDVDAIDIEKEGKELRWNEAFAPEGTNVNFVQRLPDGTLKVRTFEKGVEGETLACGTGITASAIAAMKHGAKPANLEVEVSAEKTGTVVTGALRYTILARRGDILQVDFEPAGPGIFRNIHLTGPAEFCKTSES